MKRILGVHCSTSSTFCSRILNANTLIEDIRPIHILNTLIWDVYQTILLRKQNIFYCKDFVSTPGFLTSKWKLPNQKNRHLLIKYSYHGFYHLVCRNTAFHEADDGCICKYCHYTASKRHIFDCKSLLCTSISDIKRLL